jgi:hypothetical protein
MKKSLVQISLSGSEMPVVRAWMGLDAPLRCGGQWKQILGIWSVSRPRPEMRRISGSPFVEPSAQNSMN